MSAFATTSYAASAAANYAAAATALSAAATHAGPIASPTPSPASPATADRTAAAPTPPAPAARMRETRRLRAINLLLDQAELEDRCAFPTARVDEAALRARVATGLLVNPFPQLFARASYWERLKPDAQALHVIRSAHLMHADWVFAQYSAALVHGLSVSYRLLDPVCLSVPWRVHTASTRRVRRLCAERVQRRLVAGIPVTALRQTLLECLLDAPLPDGLAIADSALRRHGIAREELVDYVRRAGKGRHGIRRALRTASLADSRAESGGESILRGRVIELGYLAPTDLQPTLADPVDQGRSYRPDLVWHLPDGRCVLGELDGCAKYRDADMLNGRTTLDVLLDERQRESRLTALGFPVMRFRYDKLRQPGYLEQILNAYQIPRADAPAGLATRPAA